MTPTTTDELRPPAEDAAVDAEPRAVRGDLVVTERAARRVLEGVIAERAQSAHEPRVRVRALADDGVEFDAVVVLDYPTRPLSEVLADLRRTIGAEAGRQLGRPVRRIDITIADFAPNPGRRARRVV